MKSMKLRLGALLMALIMCLSMLAACNEDTGSSDDDDDDKKSDKTTEIVTGDPDDDDSGDKGGSKDVLADAKKDPMGTLLSGSLDYVENIADASGATNAVPKFDSDVNTYIVDFGVPGTGEICFEAAVDHTSGKFSGTLELSADGLSAEASIWGDSDNLALKVPFLLGEEAYGIKYSTLGQDLENSALLEALGVDIDDLKDALRQELESSMAGISIEDMMEMLDSGKLEKATEDFVDAIEKVYSDLETNVAEETISVNGTDVDTVSVEYIIDGKAFVGAAEAAVKYIDDIYGDYAEMIFATDLDEALDEMKEEALSSEESLSFKVYLNKKTGVLTALELIVDEEHTISLSFTSADDKLDVDIVLAIVDGTETESMAITIDEVAESGKDGFVLELSMPDEQTKSMVISFVRDTADGAFEFSMTEDGVTFFSVLGILIYSDDGFDFMINSISAEGETMELLIRIAVKAGGKVEKVPSYKNILDMTMEDIEAIADKLGLTDGGMMGDTEEEYFEDDYYYDDEDFDSEHEFNVSISIDDIYEGMTEEEIEEFREALKDMGMTEDDYIALFN